MAVKKFHVVGGSIIPQPDFNQTDETQADYIKNKPDGVNIGKKGSKAGEIFNDYGNNTADGPYSHAQGYNTHANGKMTHTEGVGTVADSDFQHVQGKFNEIDSEGKYLDIVGNGTSEDDRSNAYTLDHDGNAWFAGDITLGEEKKEVATKDYVADVVTTQADYAELDPDAPSFIQNKPFGEVQIYDGFIDVENADELDRTSFGTDGTGLVYTHYYIKIAEIEADPCTIIDCIKSVEYWDGTVVDAVDLNKSYTDTFSAIGKYVARPDVVIAIYDEDSPSYAGCSFSSSGLYIQCAHGENGGTLTLKSITFNPRIELLEERFLPSNVLNYEYLINKPFYETKYHDDISFLGINADLCADNNDLYNQNYLLAKYSGLPLGDLTALQLSEEITGVYDGAFQELTPSVFGNNQVRYNRIGATDYTVENYMFIIDENGVDVNFTEEDTGLIGITSFPEPGVYVLVSAFIPNPPAGEMIIEFRTTIKKLDNKFLNTDETPTQDSDNLVTSDGVYQYVNDKLDNIAATGGQVQADYAETDETKASFIKNKPDVDTEVTEDSTNLISSGAVFNAIDSIIPDEQIQSDYSENDETQKSYIQNRPFYDTRKFESIESNKVLATATSAELTLITSLYVKRANLPDVPSVLINEIKSVAGGMIGQVYNNEWELLGNASYVNSSVVLVDENDINMVLIEGIYSNVSFPESGIYVLTKSDLVSEYTTIEFKGEFQQLDNKFLSIDKTPTEGSRNPITSNAVYQVNAEIQNNKTEIQEIKNRVGSGHPDYTENDITSVSHILNRPFYEEEVYKGNVITIPAYTGEEICSTVVKAVWEECKYVKIAELNNDAYTTLDHALKALKSDGTEIEINNSIEIIINETVAVVMDGYYIYLGTQYLAAIETPLSNASVGGIYDFPESGLYIRVSREAPNDGQGNPDWDNAPDFAHEFSEIHFSKIIHKLDAKFLPDEFTDEFMTLENSIETIETDVTNIKSDNTTIKSSIKTLESNIAELQNESNIISVEDFPATANNNDIIALVSDIEASFDKLNIEVKTREELSLTDENDITTVDLSGATLLKNVKINALPTNYSELDGWIWVPYDGGYIVNAEKGKVGVSIYDKTWKNGIELVWTDTVFYSNPHFEVTKIVDGVDDTTYYYLFGSLPLNEDYSSVVAESGWYKLVDGSYIALTDEELSSVAQEFDEAYITDYWAMESEDTYNETIDTGLVVQPPLAVSDFISNFITTKAEQGFYKYANSKWSKWNESSDFSGNYNDLTDKPEIPSELSELTDDAEHRTVTDAEKEAWNAKSEKGEDGISATHEWNETVLTITSASGTSSADLKGEKGDKGADGYTPIKGTDYFTDEDKAELVNSVLEVLPIWEGGSY